MPACGRDSYANHAIRKFDPRLTQLSVSIAVISLLALNEQMRDHTTIRFIAIPDLKDEHA
ncbi:hypothetical protein CUJ88_45250 (plasmid) [Paraburkholderia hospita]|nr:hypothetical protein CUJ88_45250 [Paraburkholderia hospita]